MNYIYVIQSGDYYKIGKTKNLEGRINALQTGNPIKLKLIRSIEVPDDIAYVVETALHNMFANECILNEWFTQKAVDKLNDMTDIQIRSLYKLYKKDNNKKKIYELSNLSSGLYLTCDEIDVDSAGMITYTKKPNKKPIHVSKTNIILDGHRYYTFNVDELLKTANIFCEKTEDKISDQIMKINDIRLNNQNVINEIERIKEALNGTQ